MQDRIPWTHEEESFCNNDDDQNSIDSESENESEPGEEYLPIVSAPPVLSEQRQIPIGIQVRLNNDATAVSFTSDRPRNEVLQDLQHWFNVDNFIETNDEIILTLPNTRSDLHARLSGLIFRRIQATPLEETNQHTYLMSLLGRLLPTTGTGPAIIITDVYDRSTVHGYRLSPTDGPGLEPRNAYTVPPNGIHPN